MGLISSAVLTRVSGEIPPGDTPEAELTIVQSFTRFCVDFWFIAFVFFSPPTCFIMWLLLRRLGFQKTRWVLLGLSLAISPFLLVAAWLIFRPLLFR
jgi:hypothetical protein